MMFLLDRLLRRVVRRGTLTIHHADGQTYRFGAPDPAFPQVAIRFNDKGVPSAIASNPPLGAGEGYMDRRIDVVEGEVYDLLTLFMKNAQLEHDGPSRSGF
ncbi:MAG: SAM-dependent methyltransferase, partial [Alphaproteobacteria bacterium]|nr:SAM-dependent methyltransferase [Alphaproteobacteria bacterium]